MTEAFRQHEPFRRDVRDALALSTGILLALGFIKHLAAAWPWFRENAWFSYGTVGAALQLYGPIALIGHRGVSQETLGLTLRNWRRDLLGLCVLALLTIVPYGLGHHLWQTVVEGRAFIPKIAPHLGMVILTQIFLVALPEEVFFRGLLQERFERVWPEKRRWVGSPVGWALVAQAAVFALAHFVGEYRFDRLGPFFPGLLFGLLRARTGTIVGAVGYHAFCNVLSVVLFACYARGPA
ncbi:MAG: CPBP family intramembrane metalloprotease [Deltaproteobacteria bacterium]|nr:CPBP family intramembrane metalloprotease [Deltaproteobacteria bacterium]